MKVVLVDEKMCPEGKECGKDGYVGMNYYAAKELGVPFPYSKDTAAIWRGEKDKALVKRHEECEAPIMAHGVPYIPAHSCCLIRTKDLKRLDEETRDTRKMVKILQKAGVCK
jgi:hypothetical protein